MGRKNVIYTYKMLDNVDMSTDQLSAYTNTANQDKASIQIYWTGTSPVGTITVEGTNEDPAGNVPATYITLDFGSPIAVSGNSGDHELIFNELPFRAFRIRYDATSGTGNLTAVLSSKVVGA